MGFKDVAKKYVELGFSIFPIKKGSKKPIVAWEPFQEERASDAQIDEWCRIYPEANIGIVTGKISKGLVIIDVDGPEGFKALKKYPLPPTRVAKTANGTHYYYQMEENIVNNITKVLPDVDVRGEGGYVVAPGSVHETGKLYEWTYEEPVETCPDWLAPLMAKVRDERNAPVERKNGKKSKEQAWVEKVRKGVGAGERNDACARLAGYYFAKGLDIQDILDILRGWNQRNTPPLPEKEIETTVLSISQKDALHRAPERLDGVVPLGLQACKDVVLKWLYYKDTNIIDIALAVVLSTHHTGDPLWILIIGAPSSGKTEILRGFDKHPDVYFIDRVSKATFVTGFTKAKGILERMGSEPRTFILQDFSTILSKPPYDRMEIVDTLRQIYNGSYHNEWGNGKKFTWRGKIALVAGCTPDIESHSHAMSELGERFLYYRADSDDDETRSKMMQKAKAMEGKESIAREEIAKALHGMIAHCKNVNITGIEVEKHFDDWLYNLVDMTTSMRSVVKRNFYRREVVEYTPHREGPGRMYKACQVLMKSLAVVRGRTKVNEEDYAVVVKVCVDSIQSIRREALRALRKTYGQGGVRPKDVAQSTGYQSTESIGYHLADLSALELVNRWIEEGKSQHLNAPFLYEMKERTYKKLEECGMLDIL